MTKFLSATFTILCTVALTACGPIYNTRYDFQPPQSEIGQICSVQCQSSRSACQRDEERDYSMCRSNAGRDDARRDACEKPNYKCEVNYNACFEGCGGKIIPVQHCIAFCNQK